MKIATIILLFLSVVLMLLSEAIEKRIDELKK